jgi:hypothetical protein
LVVSTKGAAYPARAATPFPERTFQYATLIVASAADAESAWVAIIAIAKTHVDTPLLKRLVIGFALLG